MAEQWEYQVRVNLGAAFAEAARHNPADPALKPLQDVLTKYNAVIKNQYDAFADFCTQAETQGDTDTELYRWTKATIERPEVKAKYATRFTVYADGGKEVYAEEIADALVADLGPLVESGMVTKLDKFSSDPAQNPQAPPKFRR